MPRSIFPSFVLLLGLCGASSASDSRGIWIDVPFVEQTRDGCGAAVIAMVMQYWEHAQGKPPAPAADARRILGALAPGQSRGIYASQMANYFNRNGFRTFAFSGSEQDLHDHLSKGRPLIIALKPGAGLPLHYVVVAGLDSDQHVVLLNDPAQRKLLKEEDGRVEREWKAAGHWTLLALPEPGGR
jgi:ABC-type bacteriocin/lantibiotic exporter with double-glycine peptidase domain